MIPTRRTVIIQKSFKKSMFANRAKTTQLLFVFDGCADKIETPI
jgi:hypothetical protein